jgi:hypothetical protein
MASPLDLPSAISDVTEKSLESVAISDRVLSEPVFLIETHDSSKLTAMSIRILLYVVILIATALMAPDSVTNTVISRPLSAFPTVGNSVKVDPPSIPFTPFDQFLICAVCFNATTVSRIDILLNDTIQQIPSQQWRSLFSTNVIDSDRFDVNFFVPTIYSNITISFMWTHVSPASTLFCVAWRIIPALLLLGYFYNVHLALNRSSVPFKKPRIVTLIICVAAFLWNDPLFICHFYLPSEHWLILDGILKDFFYVVSGIATLSFLTDLNELETIVVCLFFAAFGLVRGIDDVMHPCLFTERVERFHKPILLPFLVLYLAAFAHVATREADHGAVAFRYCVVFSAYIAAWALYFILASCDFLGASGFAAMLPGAIVNVFAVTVVALHDSEADAVSAYRAPGVGDDEENPFDFASDDADADPGRVLIGALSLI